MSAPEAPAPQSIVIDVPERGRQAFAPVAIGAVAAFAFASITRPALDELAVVAAAFLAPGVWMATRLAPGDPQAIRRATFVTGLLPCLLGPLGFFAIGSQGWIAPRPIASLLVVTLVGAAAAAESCFRWAREWPRATVDAVPSSPYATVANAALPAVACALLALDYGAWADARRSDAVRTGYALDLVESLAQLDPTLSLEERAVLVLSTPDRRIADTVGFSIDPDGRIESSDPGSPLVLSGAILDEIDSARGGDAARGELRPRGGDYLAAYRTMDDGTVLAIQVRRAEVPGPFEAGGPTWAFLALLFAGTIWHARSLERERARSVDRVARSARALADGDPESVAPPAGRGELARIEDHLYRAATSVAALFAREATTDEAVSGAIGTLSSALTALEDHRSGHAARIDEVRRLVDRIQSRAGDAQRDAGELDRALDESGHSVTELGAGGDELNETASVLTAKVDAVSDSLEQMVRSVKEVGSTTDRLAEASEETSSSMEEMASAMRAVDNAAETTASLSSDVVEKAELGQAKVVQTIAGMEAIREATDAAERVIRGLGDRTSEIGGILDVIDDVADETNLLALNAAIIAAQAGEQGKAFSVVADEIKELADRVLASTKEIGGLIRAVQEESENAIGAIEAGSSSVMSGVDLSAEAGRTLEEITEASRESGMRIQEIVNSVREQTRAASHVVNLMERVRESADQIGAASAQQDQGNEIVYRSALTMREVAQQVRRTTEDQAAGFGRIRENVVGVRGAVEQIGASLGDQGQACAEMARCLDAVGEADRVNVEASEKLRETIEVLGARSEALRTELEAFRG